MPPEIPPGLIPEGAPPWYAMAMAALWGGLWVLDKVVFYISKFRNKERISSPQAMIDGKRLESMEEALNEVSGVVKRVASGVDKVHTRSDGKILEIGYTVREIRNACDRIERRLDGIKQRD